MKSHVLVREQRLERPLDEVFAFFADPANLAAITPPWLRFRVLGASHDPLEAGAHIDYRLALRGFPLRWTSLISVWEPPFRFVDEQIYGPYRRWHHEHTFEADGGATIARDRVEYAVPGGELVRRLLVAPDLERIFAYRERRLRELLESGEPAR